MVFLNDQIKWVTQWPFRSAFLVRSQFFRLGLRIVRSLFCDLVRLPLVLSFPGLLFYLVPSLSPSGSSTVQVKLFTTPLVKVRLSLLHKLWTVLRKWTFVLTMASRVTLLKAVLCIVFRPPSVRWAIPCAFVPAGPPLTSLHDHKCVVLISASAAPRAFPGQWCECCSLSPIQHTQRVHLSSLLK